MKKTITLTIFERLQLPNILPTQAKYEIGVVCKNLRKRLALTAEDKKRVNYREQRAPNGDVLAIWNEKKDKGMPIALSGVELFVIQSSLDLLNKNEKLPTDERWLLLFEKFQGK